MRSSEAQRTQHEEKGIGVKMNSLIALLRLSRLNGKTTRKKSSQRRWGSMSPCMMMAKTCYVGEGRSYAAVVCPADGVIVLLRAERSRGWRCQSLSFYLPFPSDHLTLSITVIIVIA